MQSIKFPTLCIQGKKGGYENMDFSTLVPVNIHCPNCGHKVTGYKDDTGGVRLQCNRCKVVIYSKYRPGKGETLLRVIEPKDK